MKNNVFLDLISQFETTFKGVYDSNNLQELRESYTRYKITKENVIDWIIDNFDNDSEEYDSHFNDLDKSDESFIAEYGIPIYSDVELEEIEEIFTNYVSYFQRYGCIDSDQIISWDDTNILFEDEINNIEIITRPDILLK